MNIAQQRLQPSHIKRLTALARLSSGEIEALAAVEAAAVSVRARREIVEEGVPARQPLLLLSGWAARVRHFPDGRRQILHLLVAGDLIGLASHPDPVEPTTVVALTNVTVAPGPRGDEANPGLAEAYRLSAAIERIHLLRQVARLGRLGAYERLADLLLHLRDRLRLAGLAGETSFPLPLTQEVLADTLGLTSVHVNRTLQAMRREGAIEMHGSMVRLIEADRFEALVDYQPVWRR